MIKAVLIVSIDKGKAVRAIFFSFWKSISFCSESIQCMLVIYHFFLTNPGIPASGTTPSGLQHHSYPPTSSTTYESSSMTPLRGSEGSPKLVKRDFNTVDENVEDDQVVSQKDLVSAMAGLPIQDQTINTVASELVVDMPDYASTVNDGWAQYNQYHFFRSLNGKKNWRSRAIFMKRLRTKNLTSLSLKINLVPWPIHGNFLVLNFGIKLHLTRGWTKF